MVSLSAVLNLSNWLSYLLIVACQDLNYCRYFLLINIQQHFKIIQLDTIHNKQPVLVMSILFSNCLLPQALGMDPSLIYFNKPTYPENHKPCTGINLLHFHSHVEEEKRISLLFFLPIICQCLRPENHHSLVIRFLCSIMHKTALHGEGFSGPKCLQC